MSETIIETEGERRDIVVIGASAGGLKPLEGILAGLPEDFPGAVFVVLHIGATSHLAEVLGRASRLKVVPAESGAPIVFGQVHVAVPGRHMLLHDSHLLLRRGPRENLARPAIDPLFRSAVCTFGARTIGVILSGALNDGSAGLRAVKLCGGIAIVQHPSDARVPDMPRSAVRHVEVDRLLPAREIAPLLARLVREPAGATPPIPMEIRLETAIAAQELSGMRAEDELGVPSRFTCPECHGALWEIDDGTLLRYRCHVGHAFTAEVMLDAQGAQVEEMLWSLIRAHQERAELVRRMAERQRREHHDAVAQQMERRALDYEKDAQVMRELLEAAPHAEAVARIIGAKKGA